MGRPSLPTWEGLGLTEKDLVQACIGLSEMDLLQRMQ